MRRADRLLDILQALRGGRLRTARDLAEELEVAVRTIYRDMETLIGSGAPIEGERGVGYLMRGDGFLPPLTLTPGELSALRIGADLVAALADEETGRAFAELMVKVEAVVPDANRRRASRDGIAVFATTAPKVKQRIALARRAIRDRVRLALDYEDEHARRSGRIVRPLELEFWGGVWTLTAWCDLRDGFRCFRLDRCHAMEATAERFAPEPGRTIADFYALECHQMPRPLPKSPA
ncbi:helix-turn-helix transcriptional regulator [Methyloraptor flagellatus]|uniref:YafY family protein n=1 Tax=Methyloraptor flagellatus TaxID=3162530 RepID=A0AAU7XHL8_9HYPH